VYQLQDFTLGYAIGGIRNNPHDVHAADADQYLEGAGVNEVSHQNARRIVPFLVGCRPTATHG
jgi:hypothetical protein